MNKELDDFNRLLTAVVSGQGVTNKRQQKVEDKLWADISVPLRLKDALDRLTKTELLIIKNSLDISAGSQLKKQDLTAVLERRIPEEMDRVLAYMDHARYRIIFKIVTNGGKIAAAKVGSRQLDYFRHMGFIFSGTVDGAKTLIMPQELLDRLKGSLETAVSGVIVQRNTEWIRLTHGLLFYHGTMYVDQLEHLIARYTGEAVRSEAYVDVLLNSLAFYGEVHEDPMGFSNHRVQDPRAVVQEHELRPAIGFFPFSKEQILKAAEPGFVDRNQNHISFANFLYDNFSLSRAAADAYTGECAFAARSGESLGNVVGFLQNELGFESMEAMQVLVDRLVVFMNNTKQWALKGYASSELSALRQKSSMPIQAAGKADVIDIATRQKVGRNDPCPCGSGLKAKKCCMAH